MSPSIRKPKPAAGHLYLVLVPAAIALPSGPWSPKVCDVIRSSHPGVQFLAAQGVLSQFMRDIGPDDGGPTSSELRIAAQRR